MAMLRLWQLTCLFVVNPSWCQAAASAEKYLNEPNAFFTESEPYLAEEEGNSVLKMMTPLPVLCAVHFLPASDVDDGMAEDLEWSVQTMDMTEPAEIHSVTLNSVDPSAGEYKIALTAFLPGPSKAVLLSSTYVANLSTSPPSLTVEDATGATAPLPPNDCSFELEVSEASVGSATLELSEEPPFPVVYSLGSALADGSPTHVLSRESTTTALSAPNLALQGLQAESTYFVQGCFVDTTRHVCCTRTVSLTTEASTEDSSSCLGGNVALPDQGAVVNGVSSNWSNQANDGSFGANKAIDGVPSSAWSSDADGDDAWIEIKLPMPQPIVGVGVWSRTMGTSSEIKTFQLTLSDSTAVAQSKASPIIGPLDLKDTSQLYTFDLTDYFVGNEIPKADLIRLDVLTSTQFNTGLRSLEVYPLSEGCSQQSGQTSNPNEQGTSDPPTTSPTSSSTKARGSLALLWACALFLA